MATVPRAWITGVARPTTRFTRRAGAWTLQATRYAAASTAQAAKRASEASRLVTDALARASNRASRRITRGGEQSFRATLLPSAPASTAGGAVRGVVDAESPRSVAALLFAAGIGSGLVYGLTESWSQALTTCACLLTLVMTFSMRSAQRREAVSLQRSLDELRQSLRVTQALLQVEELEDAEELRSSGLFSPALEDDATRRISVLQP